MIWPLKTYLIIPIFVFFFILSSCDNNIREELRIENKAIERTYLKKIFPNQVDYGFSYNSTDSKYILNSCPIIDNGTSYITIDIKISEEISPEDISYFAIYIYKKDTSIKLKNIPIYELVYDKYYFPNGYTNLLKLSNFFPAGDYKVDFGFSLKMIQ